MLFRSIQSRVLKADQEFDGLYNELLLEMARNQIFLINERQLSVNQQNWLRHYFKQYLRQHITPILINPDTDLVQFLKDDYTYLAVEIIRGDTIRYALLEIPSDKVPRFVNLPPVRSGRTKPDAAVPVHAQRYDKDNRAAHRAHEWHQNRCGTGLYQTKCGVNVAVVCSQIGRAHV